MLVERAGGLQLFQHVGAVDQLGDGDLAAGQEVRQQPRDRGAGVIGIQVIGLEAGQRMRCVFGLHIHFDLVVAFLEYLQRHEIAGVVVVGLFHDLDAGGLFTGHQLLGHGDGVVAAGAHIVHRPGALGAHAAENFIVNLTGHEPMLPAAHFQQG